MTSFFIIMPICALISLIFCYKRRKGFSVDLLIFKVIASLGFIISGVIASIFSSSRLFGPIMILGAVFGLCGDFFLDLKGIYAQDKDKYMCSGFVSFFIGHIFYNSALIYINNIDIKYVFICFIASFLIAVVNISLDKLLKMKYGHYKIIVFIYSFILILTASISICSLIINGFSVQRLLMVIGSISFIISDVILSTTYFGVNFDTPFWYFVNHLTYYIAQYCIMTSILFV